MRSSTPEPLAVGVRLGVARADHLEVPQLLAAAQHADPDPGRTAGVREAARLDGQMRFAVVVGGGVDPLGCPVHLAAGEVDRHDAVGGAAARVVDAQGDAAPHGTVVEL
ncbi:hypothetical protein WEI85_45935 [Actinomycetes bacterium KLBMP 9797]